VTRARFKVIFIESSTFFRVLRPRMLRHMSHSVPHTQSMRAGALCGVASARTRIWKGSSYARATQASWEDRAHARGGIFFRATATRLLVTIFWPSLRARACVRGRPQETRARA